MLNIEAYRTRLNEIVACSKDLIQTDEINEFNKYVLEKLNNLEPSLMVYGTYNAGKSSLINAIFGEDEKAKTSDIPETDKVTGYTYKGFTIYDTPGINAPIEHELVTHAHLNKTEAVLFVISNDGSFEEEYIYQRISDIVKMNKPLILVLNNKSGIDLDSEQAFQESQKLNTNLLKIGDRNGIKNIETKVKFAVVNTKTALKGKLENKKLLIERSKISVLEDMIEQQLKDSDIGVVVNALNIYIDKYINKLISIIDSKLTGKNITDLELKVLQDMITSLEIMKNSNEIKINNLLESKLMSNREVLFDLLNRGYDSNEFLKTLRNELEHDLTASLKNVQLQIKERTQQLTQEQKEIEIKLKRETLLSSSSNNATTIEINDSNESIQIPPIPPIPGIPPVAIVIVNAVITVANLFFKNNAENNKVEKQAEAERTRVLGIQRTVAEVFSKIKSNSIEATEKALNDLFDILIENYKKDSVIFQGQKKYLIDKKDKLHELIINQQKI